MKNTHIEWCDHTFNPWEGCMKVSPGCAHCYAETRNARFGGGTAPNWGKGAPRRRTSVQNWNQVRKWNREANLFLQCTQGCRFQSTQDGLEGFCPGCGDPQADTVRPRVFCASLADWLDDEVPIEWLRDLLQLIQSTPKLDWLLLTKRPENFSKRVHEAFVAGWDGDEWASQWLDGKAPENVWIGTTVEDQQRADERIPQLLEIPARVRFLSCEPLLGPVDLTQWIHPEGRCGECLELIRVDRESVSCGCCCEGAEPTLTRNDLIDWVICGGESGPGARPMHPQWATSLRDQCKAAGVPFLFKQWGEWVPWTRDLEYPAGTPSDFVMLNGSKYRPGNYSSSLKSVMRIGKKAAGRLLDGIEHNGFPA